MSLLIKLPYKNDDNKLIALDSNWFHANTNIVELAFHGGNYHFTVDALKSNAFRTIEKFSIQYANVAFGAGFLGRQQNIHRLAIIYSNVNGDFSKFLPPFRATKLAAFMFRQILPDYVRFDDFFQHSVFDTIRGVTVICHKQFSESMQRELTSNAMAGIPRVRSLVLEYCGIVSIELNAFDSLPFVFDISLASNKLKEFDFHLLSAILNRMPVKSIYYHMIELYDNPFVCNCDFYEMKSLALHMYGYELNYSLTCEHPVDFDVPGNCANVQVMHPNGKGLEHVDESETFYVYTKFILKHCIANDQSFVSIRAHATGRFRVLFGKYYDKTLVKRGKCADRYLLRTLVKCIFVSNATETIPIDEFAGQFALPFVAVIYQNVNDFVWPLHLITIRRSTASLRISWLVYCQCSAICLGGLALGIGLYRGYQSSRKSRTTGITVASNENHR